MTRLPKLSPLVVALGLCATPLFILPIAHGAEPVERIEITGSRIAREEVVSYAPITVFDEQAIAQLGITSVDTLLQRISASAGFAGNQTSAYWTSGGYGSTQVNLRGLGINRTLVLLNGRRMLNSGTGANASVDLNTIPVSIIKKIEVLKDGASAIYGADAVAGVVNIITHQQLDGIQLSARVGQTEQGDGEQYTMSVTAGQVWSDASAYLALSYDKTQRVPMTSRAKCPIKVVNNEKTCGGSTSITQGRGQFINEQGQPFGDTLMLVPGGTIGYTSADALNYFKYFNAVQPVERFNAFSALEYDVTSDIKLFAEAMFTTRTSHLPATPQTISKVTIPAQHAFNPTNQDFYLESRRIGEAPRDFEVNSETWRIVTGVQGSVFDDWYVDFSLNHGRNTGDFLVTNVIDKPRLAQATDYVHCDANPDINCANLWGENSLTDDMLKTFLIDTFDKGGNEQFSVTANLSGELLSLPAGALAMAAGFEYRKEKGWYNPDARKVSGQAMTNQQDPIKGQYSAKEAYLEVVVPVFAEQDFAKKLELTGALRYSDFDTFGDDVNYKLGLQWQVNSNWMIRATRSSAFRVPNVPELFGGIRQGSMNTTDPCSNWTALDVNTNRYKNCQASGIPESYVLEGTVLTDRGGNPALEPEQAKTLTAGLVWQLDSIAGLSFTLDYYDIEIDNAINSVNGSNKLAACYDSVDLSHPFCRPSEFKRDSNTGKITYLQTQLGNASAEKLSGFDIGAFYQASFNGIETTSQLELSYLNEYSIQTFKDAPISDKEGTIGYDGSYSQWRANLYFSAGKNNWQLSYNAQYIGKADDEFATVGTLGDAVGTVIYHNMQYRYGLTTDISLFAGVDNLFDKPAPYHQSYTDGNTNTMTYDLQGRRFYVGVNITL